MINSIHFYIKEISLPREKDFPKNCSILKKSDDKSFCSVVGVKNCISYKSVWSNGKEQYQKGQFDYDGLENLNLDKFSTTFQENQ